MASNVSLALCSATPLADRLDAFKNRSVLRTDVLNDEVFGTTVCFGLPTADITRLRGGLRIPPRDDFHRHATRRVSQGDIWRRRIRRDRECRPPAAREFPGSQSSPAQGLRERGLRRPEHCATEPFVTAVSEPDGLGNGWRAGRALLDAVLAFRPDRMRFVGTENTAATRAPLCDSLTGAVAAMTSGVEQSARGWSIPGICDRTRVFSSLNGGHGDPTNANRVGIRP